MQQAITWASVDSDLYGVIIVEGPVFFVVP